MNAEIVVIGSEMLLGEHVDTNSVFLARELNAIGVSVLCKTVIGDNRGRMREVLARAFARSDLTLTSGGLGPTEDDLTREVVAEVAGVDLEFRQDLCDHIEGLFNAIGRPMTPNNRKQAFVPTGAEAIVNPQGTAPIFIVTGADGHRIICLPGVPRELEWLMTHEVLPRIIREHQGIIKSRSLLICGLGESRVDEQVGDLLREATNPTLGILAHQFITKLRMTARGRDEVEANALIAEMERDLRGRFGKQIYGADGDTLEGVVTDLFDRYEATVAVAEMQTGGALCRRLTSAGGDCFRGGTILPSPAAVETFLGGSVPEGGLEALAAALAVRAQEVHDALIGIGIAGKRDTLSQSEHVFGGGHTGVALAMPEEEPQTWVFPFGGTEAARQDRVAVIVLELVRRALVGAPTLG